MKSKVILTLVISIGFGLVAWALYVPAQKTKVARQTWEYMKTQDSSTEGLNRLGVEGWEIVSTYNNDNWIYLKRAK